MVNQQIYIIGSGIIGLSIAEYFSRQNVKATIISNDNPLSGSYAAAANLATKGQMFGRDPHFQIKIDAKKIYPTWIKQLIDEYELKHLNKFPQNINSFFRMGKGLDVFHNHSERNLHLKRVLQNTDELLFRNLPIDSIVPYEENSIIYKDEGWIDATLLISLLKAILKKRAVNFINKSFSKMDLQEIFNQNGENLIIFSAGAWTKQLLKELELPLSSGFNKPERLTIGSTFTTQHTYSSVLNDFVLYEKVSQFSLKKKVTLSGNSLNQYISSSTVKIKSLSHFENVNSFYKNELNKKNEELILLAKGSIADVQDGRLEKIGLRVGYGHSEILIEPLNILNENTRAIVCCGAHKSGFLFAPLLGEKIEEEFLK